MKTKLLITLMPVFLSGCTVLTTQVLSTGLHEQYIDLNPALSNDEHTVYEVKDAPVTGDNHLHFQSDHNSKAQKLIAQYQISPNGDITTLPQNPASPIKPIILASDLKCIQCIKPRRYREPSGYLALPLLIVAIPLDAVATIVTVPIALIGGGIFETDRYAKCAINSTMKKCPE